MRSPADDLDVGDGVEVALQVSRLPQYLLAVGGGMQQAQTDVGERQEAVERRRVERLVQPAVVGQRLAEVQPVAVVHHGEADVGVLERHLAAVALAADDGVGLRRRHHGRHPGLVVLAAVLAVVLQRAPRPPEVRRLLQDHVTRPARVELHDQVVLQHVALVERNRDVDEEWLRVGGPRDRLPPRAGAGRHHRALVDHVLGGVTVRHALLVADATQTNALEAEQQHSRI